MSAALIIGAGPAGLMAAEQLAQAGVAVTICEAKPSAGRKFLMAGKSGLNLTKDEPFDALLPNYFDAAEPLRKIVQGFDAQAVQDWARALEQDLFTGSTGLVFPKVMKASPLLRAWLGRLEAAGVVLRRNMRWTGWDGTSVVFDTPTGREVLTPDVVVLALGGASWARLGADGKWAEILAAKGVDLAGFAPSNAGVRVPWTDHMAPTFGSALKSVKWQAGDLKSRGEAVITARGLEGGGIYALTPAIRAGHPLRVDLMPDLSEAALRAKLPDPKKKARLTHWLKNTLRLPSPKVALIFEMAKQSIHGQADWVPALKSLPVTHQGLLPMDEAISTAGGVAFSALDQNLMLKAVPGVFCAGEMIDWEAPTGGYLITGCLATGRWAGRAAADYLAAAR